MKEGAQVISVFCGDASRSRATFIHPEPSAMPLSSATSFDAPPRSIETLAGSPGATVGNGLMRSGTVSLTGF
jgi:hypothetical protein